MKKRFIWSLLFAIIPMLVLIPFNQYLLSLSTNTFDEGFDRIFAVLTINEYLIIYLVAFVMVNQYFIMHPDEINIIHFHRANNPDIPDSYYRRNLADKEREHKEEGSGSPIVG